ncbi:Glycosyltransferase involved in cell wall bisynthesis [Seinonella peptonophila]|uniref:Glycosyltransferase involved in cell wall bisynthesis n=1 Tax=Seinonella peptonophila TaxID=112248 RepID=A0A1M4YLD6_9BACL|nr:glycosyltransferase family 2 protein [Seinonella peptonophila]SHF06560.1 Glycosyltransferase involved in cell wall bisynthesis [Seinonella peptonophila]
MKPLLIVVIPAWNEAKNIAHVIQKVPRTWHPDLEVSILVIDDGSTDGTAQVATAAGAEQVYSFSQNRGLGAAVREGLKKAYQQGADLAVMIDADNEYPAHSIPSIVQPILDGRADYVMGSRFKGHIRGMKWHRRLANISFTLLQSLLLGRWIWDGQSGFRAFSRLVLRDLRINHDYNYAQVMTLSILRQGYRMLEVPIDYQVRQAGTSFIKGTTYLRRVLPAIWKEWRTPTR